MLLPLVCFSDKTLLFESDPTPITTSSIDTTVTEPTTSSTSTEPDSSYLHENQTVQTESETNNSKSFTASSSDGPEQFNGLLHGVVSNDFVIHSRLK